MNQIEASVWKEWGAYDNTSLAEYLLDEFFGSHGKDHNDGEDFIGIGIYTQGTRQQCKNLFIAMSFRGKSLYWEDLADENQWDEPIFRNIGPSYTQTDFGACCLFVPHVDFEPFGENITLEEKYHGLNADSQNGENNGLKLLLDAR